MTFGPAMTGVIIDRSLLARQRWAQDGALYFYSAMVM